MKKSIVDVLEEYGLDLKQEGSLKKAYCPFHNDTKKPNFTVYEETDSWFCYACNEGGDIVKFISKIEGISRSDAFRKFHGTVVNLDDLREKIQGLDVDVEPLSYSEEVNIFVSKFCQSYLVKHPQDAEKVFAVLKQLDNSLLIPIAFERMQGIIQNVKITLND